MTTSLLAKMKRQLKFDSSSEFERFIECPMSHEEYVKYLEKQGFTSD
ncbi:MAG TPA: hypothetical protein VM534_09970 [Thermoanaerobaculia bacterium]|nr:hypothetical protein [Thermoanaerobaculia bacterium]